MTILTVVGAQLSYEVSGSGSLLIEGGLLPTSVSFSRLHTFGDESSWSLVP